MSNKRETPRDYDAERTIVNKRPRFMNSDDSSDLPLASQSRIDPTYGQRGAFPGLEGTNNDDELFYGPAGDGLEYLRMVR